MRARIPRVDSSDIIPLLLGGASGAVWMLLVQADAAYADDCLRYIKNVKNFVSIPKDLMEDCMRTGSVQAIITAAVGSVGGGVIAKAVNDALKGQKEKKAPGPESPDYKEGREGPDRDNPWDPSEEEKRKKWKDDKVVWDPKLLGWRPPKPDELPPPERDVRKGPSKDEIKKKWEEERLVWDPEKNTWRKKSWDESPPPEYPPEEAPFEKQNPRAQTPAACIDLYDDYVKTQRRMLELEPEIEKTALDIRLAQDWLNLKLGIFTAQFAIDVSDFMQLGGALVRAAVPISQVIGKINKGAVKSAVRSATKRAASLAKAAAEMLQELAQIGAKAVKLRTAANILKESARVLRKYADDLAEAVLALDRRVAKNRQLLAVAENLEPLQTKRAAIVSKLVDAEKRLAAAEKIWQRKHQLQRWAEGERVSITAEQSRLAIAAQQELDSINEEIRTLQARIAQSPELTNAQKRTGKATTTRAKIDARIRELEAESKRLTANLDAAKKRAAYAQSQIDQAAKLEQEIGELEGFRAESDARAADIQRLKEELEQLESTPEMQQYKAERQRLYDEQQAAFDKIEPAQIRFEAAGRAEMEFKDELVEEARKLGIDGMLDDLDVLPPAKAAELKAKHRAIQQEINDSKSALDEAKIGNTNARARRDAGWAELDAKESALVSKHNDLKSWLASYENDGEILENRLRVASGTHTREQYDKRIAELREDARQLRSEGQAGLDRDPVSIEAMETARKNADDELAIRRPELADADREFNDATNIENNVRTQLEGTERATLDARKAAAQEKLRKANRGWQEVAAERNPGDFQEWKLTVEGTDPFNDGPNELRPLQQEVLDGRKADADVEKEISAQRDKAEDLKKQIADDESAANQKRPEADAAHEKAKTAEGEAKKADQEAADAEAEYADKDGQVKNAKARQEEAETEARKEQAEGPAPDGDLDPQSQGKLDAIDSIAKRSHDLSEQMKPGWARGTEDALKHAASAFGDRWNKLFNGQSPEDVAEGLKKSRDKVIRLSQQLEQMKAEYDTARNNLQTVKPKLDACVRDNTYWTGPT